MRDIELRGKRKEVGDWLYGYLTDFDKIRTKDCPVPYSSYFVIPETVGQYTGLKDKNGVRIFEGDIVKSEVSIGDVQFSHGMFGIEWTRAKTDKSMVGLWGQLHNLRRMDDGFNENVEVIGNIHDNPELLRAN